MLCPYNRDVGDPPHLTNCPLGFPGCGCIDVLMPYAYGDLDPQDVPVLRFWQRHAPEDWSGGKVWEPSGDT